MRKNKLSIKKILSVEYNVAHDIITPSVYKYFTDLGYEVDFLLAETESKKRWDFFVRIDDNIKTITANYDEMNKILTSKDIKEYDFIIFNTSFSFMEDFKYPNIPILEAVYKSTGKYPDSKWGFLTIPPHVSGFFGADSNLLKGGKYSDMYVINHVGYNGLPLLAANYFGDVKVTPKSDKNIFLATGNIAPHQKNHKLLITAADKLDKEGLSNFKIIINGSGEKLDIPQHLIKYFEFVGDNKPDKLFEIIEKSDFIAALLDSSVEWQRNQYGHGTCSCALMYSLGFSKPLLIEDYFTVNYGLNNDNSIIYEGQNLYTAMKKAILMSKENYSELQNQVKAHSDYLSEKTLKDMKNLLIKAKRDYYPNKIRKFLRQYSFIRNLGKVIKNVLNK